MAQTVTFITINGELYPNFEGGVLDQRWQTIEYVENMISEKLIDIDDEYDVESTSYNIGDGEAGVDHYYSDEQLFEYFKSGNFEEKVESDGYSVDAYNTSGYSIDHSELDIEEQLEM